jgi:hypothetical protein
MATDFLSNLKEAVREGRYRFSYHAEREREADRIRRSEVIELYYLLGVRFLNCTHMIRQASAAFCWVLQTLELLSMQLLPSVKMVSS